MTPQFNHLLLASTLSAGLTLPLTTIAQTTQTALSVQHVDIAAGDLTGALNQLATRFGISLQFNADLTNGLSTQGITGETNLNQGFAQLLGGTGLTAIAKGDGVYVIQQVEGDMVLSPVKVQSTAKTRFGDAPAEPGGLKAEYQSTATKMAMPLKETPQAISVVTRYSMDVRQVRDVPNAIELATGVSISTAGGGSQ
jgi:outer membrane receptor for ferric coprogen and ferric-rhodotorulic acid